MNLTIVIPALNEEKSIENIIKRTIQASDYIISNSPVNSIDITVVSDGSTDDTVEIANKFTDKIKLIVFKENKGYGAAIKEGWSQSNSELLGFLDADGTCDPNFFCDLCNILINENADIALGSRLNENSQMPFIRRIGNKIFSTLLSLVSFQRIKDTASGMRVIRRESILRIMPLPDGLHFTPAMSARAILSHDLKIIEKDMTYQEREGQSKLKVIRDGIRFINIIFKMILLYQPYKVLTFVSIMGFILSVILMASPIIFYLQHTRVEEWMIYRFIVSELTSLVSLLLLSASYITKKILALTLSNGLNVKQFSLSNIFKKQFAIWIILISLIISLSMVYESFLSRITTGVTYEHWSRFIAMSFFCSVSFIFFVTLIINHVINLINERLYYYQSQQLSK